MLIRSGSLAFSTFLMTVAVTVCPAQSITSARSGTLHYFEGDVSIDGTQTQSRAGKFAEIKEQGVLRTGLGRAEILLTPGVFLRVGENSAVRMLDNRLGSTRVELLSGTAMVESDDPQMSLKDSPVAIVYDRYEIRLARHGLLEIAAESPEMPAQMKVFKGEAVVTTMETALETTPAGNRFLIKDGHMLTFSAAPLTEKFSEKSADDLYVWSRDRSQNLSAANMSSARSIGNSFQSGTQGSGSARSGNWNNGWYYNPYFDMFTFVPQNGVSWNAWGYGFYSPVAIREYYAPAVTWYGGTGARGATGIGRPISALNGAQGGSGAVPAPLSGLSGGGGNGRPALGSPVRSGGMAPGGGFGAPTGGQGGPAAASRGSFGGGAGSRGSRGR